MSQVYLAEHRGSILLGETGNQIITNQINSNVAGFLVRGENRRTQGKTSRSRVENQQTQQTQPTYDVIVIYLFRKGVVTEVTRSRVHNLY